MSRRTPVIAAVFLLVTGLTSHSDPASTENAKPADMSKPVQVYILLGQSNMLGFGKIGGADRPGSLTHAVKKKKLYPYLIDDAG
ncbi:MAG: sialate O-acetylesterase, partial [Planctomycetota bacterium]|nr:sialate O-acetylesterase [Planctomycetota bacterium]